MVVSVTDVAKLYPSTAIASSLQANLPAAPAFLPRWHVVCTKSRHERMVARTLLERSIETFLPTFESQRQWHDRKKNLQLPIFPGYLFVRVAYAERLRVLAVPGVARFVTFGDSPAVLADDELDQLRSAVSLRKAEPHPFLATGTRVQIVAGPLKGLRGIVQRERRPRLIVSVHCLCRSIAVDLEECDVRAEEN